MKSRYALSAVTCLLSLVFAFSAASAQTVPYQKLLLLIVGPSGDRIVADEQEVVAYLNRLRNDYGLNNIQMGTMHFDRPRESRILKDSLGLDPKKGVTLALVQLSDQGVPVRTLYKREAVTAAVLESEHKDLLTKWSQISGERLPAELAAITSGTQRPPITNPSSQAGDIGPPQAKVDVTFSPEGVTSVIGALNNQLVDLWDYFRNVPVRTDQKDIVLRQMTLGLLEASTELHRIHTQEGLVYPLRQLENLRRAARDWEKAEPQYYMPVELRPEVPSLIDLLEQLETIEYQGANL